MCRSGRPKTKLFPRAFLARTKALVPADPHVAISSPLMCSLFFCYSLCNRSLDDSIDLATAGLGSYSAVKIPATPLHQLGGDAKVRNAFSVYTRIAHGNSCCCRFGPHVASQVR